MRSHAPAQCCDVHWQALADAHMDPDCSIVIGAVDQHHTLAAHHVPQGAGHAMVYGYLTQMRPDHRDVTRLLQRPLGQREQAQPHGVGLGGLSNTGEPFVHQRLEEAETGARIEREVPARSG